jgi:hypothetical protein
LISPPNSAITSSSNELVDGLLAALEATTDPKVDGIFILEIKLSLYYRFINAFTIVTPPLLRLFMIFIIEGQFQIRTRLFQAGTEGNACVIGCEQLVLDISPYAYFLPR